MPYNRFWMIFVLLAGLSAEARAVSVYIDLEARVQERAGGEMVYGGTLAIKDVDNPEDVLREWVEPMEIEVNGVRTSLPATPRTTPNEFGFHVYDWVMRMPVATEVKLTVKDRNNSHVFFGGAITASGGSSLEIYAHDADLDCGGSTTSRRAETPADADCERLRARLSHYRNLHAVDLRRRN